MFKVHCYTVKYKSEIFDLLNNNYTVHLNQIFISSTVFLSLCNVSIHHIQY